MNLINKIDRYLDEEDGAEKMVKAIEKRKKGKYTEEERSKLKAKFEKNMDKMKKSKDKEEDEE